MKSLFITTFFILFVNWECVFGKVDPLPKFNPRKQDDSFLNGTFPPKFLWGFATSSYQIEGAWDTDGILIMNILFIKIITKA